MELLIRYLQNVHPLSEGLKEYLFQVLKLKEITKREILLKEGQVCRHIYFIKKGLFRCYYIKDGLEISSWFMKENDVIISVESFYQQKPSFEYIQAIEDSTVYYIGYEDLQFIYKSFPEFNVTGRILTEKYYLLSEQRSRSIRMQKAHERYISLLENHSELIPRVPSKHLSSYLGISEETLSRIRSGKKY